MRADLHMHSVWSDGALTADELACRCREAGLSLFSVTDHDSLGGLSEKQNAARAQGLSYLSGWEISAYEHHCKIHVLGYGCGTGEIYLRFLEERRQGALARAEEMIARANACFGLCLTLADAEREHRRKETPLHTMCVVGAFAKRLSVSPGELYRSTFQAGCPAYSELGRPTPEQAIEVIHALGGIAVLAHPGRIRLCDRERRDLTERLVRLGLDGIECHYTTHTVSETEDFLAFAKSKNLFVTGGSDFHADDGIHHIGLPAFEPDPMLLRKLSEVGDRR